MPRYLVPIVTLVLSAPYAADAQESGIDGGKLARAFVGLVETHQAGLTTQALLSYCGYSELASSVPPTDAQRGEFYVKWMIEDAGEVLTLGELDVVERMVLAMQAGVQQGISTTVGMAQLTGSGMTQEQLCNYAPGVAATLMQREADAIDEAEEGVEP